MSEGTFRLAVLISGEGTNLQAILDQLHRQEIAGGRRIEVVGVASSNATARGLERARSAGVETAVFEVTAYPGREGRDAALADWLAERQVDLIVLAGFMQILSPGFIERFRERIVNVHPALLPSFAGVNAIKQALEHGVKVMGVTVHFVDEGIDSGPIILQEAFEVPYPRHIEAIEQRVHEIEHRLLPRAIRLIAARSVTIDPSNPRLVHVEGR